MNTQKIEQDIKTIHEYYKAFVNKDINKINELISDDILLLDWEIECNGREDFLKTNLNLFTGVGDISVTAYSMFWGIPVKPSDGIDTSLDTYFCPINVTIGENSMEIIDLISIDSSGKICGVIAYKQ